MNLTADEAALAARLVAALDDIRRRQRLVILLVLAANLLNLVARFAADTAWPWSVVVSALASFAAASTLAVACVELWRLDRAERVRALLAAAWWLR